jgi:hypothetical protein
MYLIRLMATHLPFLSIADSSGAPDPCHVAPWTTFTHINSDDSSDDGDDSSQEAVSQVAKLLESQRDSSKTLSSADDVESDEESTDETGSDSSDESNVDTDSNPVPTSKKVGVKGRLPRRKSLQRHPPMSAPALALIRILMRRMNCQAFQNTKQSRLQVQTPAPARIRIRILTRIISLQRRTN